MQSRGEAHLGSECMLVTRTRRPSRGCVNRGPQPYPTPQHRQQTNIAEVVTDLPDLLPAGERERLQSG